MKACPFCGAKVPKEAIYCLNCSSVLNERQSFPVVKVKDKKKKVSKRDRQQMMISIENEMKEAAKNLDFERAMELRDILFEMKSE